MIEYARIMEPNELKEFFDSIKKLSESKKTIADNYFYDNQELFVQAYYEYEELQINEYQKQKNEINQLYECWQKKICFGCSSKLKLIDSDYGKFWGCTNFRDKSKEHKNFSLNYEEIHNSRKKGVKVRINAHWATDILKKTNSKNKIKASQLLRMYEEIGIDDLRVKYGYKETIKSISGYVTAKKNSFKEELEIIEKLSKHFPKHKSQLGIRYKLESDIERVAIIDLILSDNKDVYVIEIKRSVYDIKQEQLKLYFKLMKYIMDDINDERNCLALFVVYNKQTYSFHNEEKYILYDHLKNIDSKKYLKTLFNENAEINGR
ncbi:hypothetical protein HPE56_20095 [Maribacter sp. ANRC-HE7]|uniref:PD-(D/E)XK nuclease superfamily protein n=1 Tax=Maribacter aquimaris TaxID=2737171 RepID=A0ABR7V9U9_9FLAO|nr:hypothetical protein [Maribacter aquimaris]MBD0780107.1 hypothetical protein [Maribacter aquimaris]